MTDREAIARIIEPNVFPFEVCQTWDYERVKQQNTALTKADAILNLISQPLQGDVLYRMASSVEDAREVYTEVTRADRNAAYSYFNIEWTEAYGIDADDRPFLSGALDDNPLVQAFTQHRIDILSRQAQEPKA